MTRTEQVLIALGLTGLAALVVGALRGTASRTRRIALIGDSLALGLGPLLAAKAKAAGVPFQFEGHVGTTPLQWATSNGCGQCGSWLQSFQPSTTLVVLGTNDLGMVTPVVSYYTTIRDRVLATGSQVIWVEPPIMPKHPLTAVRQTIESLGVPVIPGVAVPIGPDGIHPTPPGYMQWSDIIWSQVP